MKNTRLNWLAILVAAIVSFLFEALWPRHPLRSPRMAGFVATSWAKAYIFEVRTLEIYAINTV